MGQIIGCNECNNIEIAWTDGVSLLCSKQITVLQNIHLLGELPHQQAIAQANTQFANVTGFY